MEPGFAGLFFGERAKVWNQEAEGEGE